MGDLFTAPHLIFVFVLLLIILPVYVIPYWLIFKKAGFAPALSLLMVFPLVKIIVLYVIALSDWKAGVSHIVPNPGPPLP
jgi:hypothetical protein